MRAGHVGIAIGACLATVLATAAPAHAGTVVASWGMNEASGATVMDDAAGANDGRIGSRVKTGVTFGKGRGYSFTSPGDSVADRSALVLVPDSSALDPGDRNVNITIEVATTDVDGNLLQKGQAGTYGGRYKVDISSGYPECQFQGSIRERHATWHTKINDGRPHTIVCERLADRVRISVDGGTPVIAWNATGTIANAKELSLGGKPECNGTTVDCDYLTGRIGSARITFG
jgi:hypothetical protein